LLSAATHPDFYLVITLCSEFLGDCSLYPDLPEAINAGFFLMPSLPPSRWPTPSSFRPSYPSSVARSIRT